MRSERSGSLLTSKWTLLFFFAAAILAGYSYASHRSFRDTIVGFFNKERAFNVKLLSELTQVHFGEAAENLKHIDAMISGMNASRDDYAYHAAMFARDHFDDVQEWYILNSYSPGTAGVDRGSGCNSLN